MNYRTYILMALMLMLQSGLVFSQGCEGDDPSASDTKSGSSINLFGYIQPEYDFNFAEGNDNSIKFKRARIGVRGNVSDDFAYYFMLEASPFIGSTSDVYLMDAFVTYNKYNWARASVGSFKQPFGLEVTTACHNLITIDRSMVVDQLVAPQRDFGLALFGSNKYTRINYAVALMNGRGLRVQDDNSKKDIIGRVTYKLTNFLTIGSSFRYGYPIPNNNEDSRLSINTEVALDLAKIHVEGEFVYDEGAYFLGSAGGCGSTPVALGEQRSGAHMTAYYRITDNFHPVIKYEYFDPDMETNENSSYQERMTIGANYFFNEKVRLQVNYQANIERVGSENDDALKAQIQIKF